MATRMSHHRGNRYFNFQQIANDKSKLYSVASTIVQKVYAKKGHPQSLVYATNGLNKRALMAIVMSTLGLTTNIGEIITRENLLESYSDENKARIWISQILTGNQNYLQEDPEFVKVLEKSSIWQKIFKEPKVDKKCTDLLPKYLRVNTILYSLDQAIEYLNGAGFTQIHYDKALLYEKYLKLVQALTRDQFLVDFHFPDVLVFFPNQPLYATLLVENGFAAISDKSSYIAGRLLSPPPGSHVIDACAAPGLKTLHIASLMKNTGKLFCYDLDLRRFEELKRQLGLGGVTCCVPRHFDFFRVNTSLETYQNVEYILVDPSCSGSGMAKRVVFENDNHDKNMNQRLTALTNVQKSLLKRALYFPNVKRVVYSTCSVNNEENEMVVEEVLSFFQGVFEVVDAFPEWPERGSPSYEFGLRCIKTNSSHLTNGFFVAVIQRIGWVPPKVSEETPTQKRKLETENSDTTDKSRKLRKLGEGKPKKVIQHFKVEKPRYDGNSLTDAPFKKELKQIRHENQAKLMKIKKTKQSKKKVKQINIIGTMTIPETHVKTVNSPKKKKVLGIQKKLKTSNKPASKIPSFAKVTVQKTGTKAKKLKGSKKKGKKN